MLSSECSKESDPAQPENKSRAQRIREVLKYWTRERMSDTKPIELPKIDPAPDADQIPDREGTNRKD